MFSFLDWPQVITYITSVILLNLLPGMNVTFICAESLRGGKRYGIFAGLGISTGVALYIAATIFGIGELFILSPKLFNVIQFLGIGYLFFLAYEAFFIKASIIDLEDVGVARNIYKAYGKGILTTLLNPKELLFFCTFLPQFTNECSPVPMMVQLFYLGLWDIFTGTIVNMGYAVLVAKIRHTFLKNIKVQNRLQYVIGIIFTVLAVGLLYSEYRNFC